MDSYDKEEFDDYNEKIEEDLGFDDVELDDDFGKSAGDTMGAS